MRLASCEEAPFGRRATRKLSCSLVTASSSRHLGRASPHKQTASLTNVPSVTQRVRDTLGAAGRSTRALLVALVAGGGRRLDLGQAALQAGRAAGVRRPPVGGGPLQGARRLAQLPDADAVVGSRLFQQPPRGEGPRICGPIRQSQCHATWAVSG